MTEQNNKNIFRKKFLFPLSYACMVGLGIWGATALIHQSSTIQPVYSAIEPASGEENSPLLSDQIPPIDEKDIIEAPPITGLDQDAPELAPLRISPDKPEIITLDRDAINVMVGSDEHLRAVPDTNRTIILIPKKPGATYFKALDANGNTIMQRHVIIGAAKNDYIRIRRACINGDDGCKEFSVYYCPDTCHEVNVMQDTKAASAPAPTETSATPQNEEPIVE